MCSDHHIIFHGSILCENLNLTVKSDLAPSLGNFIISLIICPLISYLLVLVDVYQHIICEDGILKFSSNSMLVKGFYTKKGKMGNFVGISVQVTELKDLSVNFTQTRFFLDRIFQTTCALWYPSFYLVINSQFEKELFSHLPKLYWGFKLKGVCLSFYSNYQNSFICFGLTKKDCTIPNSNCPLNVSARLLRTELRPVWSVW